MASSFGFSIASSPQGAIGGISGSPVKSNTMERKGPSARDLLDQIRHLEAEGQKLRTDTSTGIGILFIVCFDLIDQDWTCSKQLEIQKSQ